MRLLLDTHVALWAVAGDRRFTASARQRVLGADQVFVSAVSLWEIAIKHGLGRGDMPVSADIAAAELRAAGFEELPVGWRHVQRVAALPQLHRDPFDRLLVAQALEEPLIFVTHDDAVAAYSPTIIRI